MRNYRRAEASQRERESDAPDDALAAERAERLAGIVKIERGPAAFRVTFPRLSDPDPAVRKLAFQDARAPMADVKAIMGRRYDSVQAAWIVPLDQAASVELLADEYAAHIEDVALAAGLDAEYAARIADLERQLAVAEAARDAAVALADEYARALEGMAA